MCKHASKADTGMKSVGPSSPQTCPLCSLAVRSAHLLCSRLCLWLHVVVFLWLADRLPCSCSYLSLSDLCQSHWDFWSMLRFFFSHIQSDFEFFQQSIGSTLTAIKQHVIPSLFYSHRVFNSLLWAVSNSQTLLFYRF